MTQRSVFLVTPRTPAWQAHKAVFALPEVRILGDSDDAAEALAAIADLHPDRAFVATRLPSGSSQSLVVQLKRRQPELRVVAVAEAPDRREARAFIRLGVSDYLLRDELDSATVLRCLDRGRSPAILQVSRAALLAAPEPEAASLSVLLTDRDRLSRSGLRTLLGDDPRFRIVGETAVDPVRAAERLQPDLIVLDPSSRGSVDRALLGELHRVAPHARLVILTAAFEPSSFLAGMLARVHAWLAKRPETSPELIQEALALVGHFGAVIVDGSIAERFWSYPGTPLALTLPQEPAVKLGRREQPFLELVKEGAGNHEIAASLEISDVRWRRASAICASVSTRGTAPSSSTVPSVRGPCLSKRTALPHDLRYSAAGGAVCRSPPCGF